MLTPKRWDFVCFEADGVPGGSPLETTDALKDPDPQPVTGLPKDDSWQKRATGWQKLYQERDTELKSTQAELDAVRQNVTRLETTNKDFAAQLQVFVTSGKEKDGIVQELQTHKERADLILSEFPQLISFYKDGLLPIGTGEELKTKLTAFSEKLKSVNTGVIPPITMPTPPPAPNGTPPSVDNSPEALLVAARAELMKGNTDGYNLTMDQYFKNLKQK